jgi:hypothetical protein
MKLPSLSLTSRTGCLSLPSRRVYGRGTPFITEIGIGKAIKGWDEGRASLHSGGQSATLTDNRYDQVSYS